MNKKSNASKCVFLIKQNILVFTNTIKKEWERIFKYLFVYLLLIHNEQIHFWLQLINLNSFLNTI